MIEKYEGQSNLPVMTRREVREFDHWAINTVGIPGVVLMENAGRGCTEILKERLAGAEGGGVRILCGTGNNGGDGYVIARHLACAGIDVRVAVCGERRKVGGDADVNLRIIEKMGLPLESLDPADGDTTARVEAFCSGADMLVDAVFGTGLSGNLKGGYEGLIKAVNAQSAAVLAVDIPSGLDCDEGRPLPVAIEADVTVTFAAVKKGFTSEAARRYTGDIYVACIGITPGQHH